MTTDLVMLVKKITNKRKGPSPGLDLRETVQMNYQMSD